MALVLALASVATARNAPPFAPRSPFPPRPPNAAAIAMAACMATNVTTFNTYLNAIQTKVNNKLAANTTTTKTTSKSHYVYDGHIPGNLLGFNLWPGCDFSGTNSNTTIISGLNQLRLVDLETSNPPSCSLSNGIANMSSGRIPFTFEVIQPITFSYKATYSGTWCDIPGANTEYLSASGSLSGLSGTGFIEVQAVVNSTTICIDVVSVSDIVIIYSSVSLKASIPPLGISKDVSSKVAGKLNAKLPSAAKNIQDRINSMAASKLPFCKVINS